MKKSLKTLLAVFICTLLTFSFCTLAFATQQADSTPDAQAVYGATPVSAEANDDVTASGEEVDVPEEPKMALAAAPADSTDDTNEDVSDVPEMALAAAPADSTDGTDEDVSDVPKIAAAPADDSTDAEQAAPNTVVAAAPNGDETQAADGEAEVALTTGAQESSSSTWIIAAVIAVVAVVAIVAGVVISKKKKA